MPIISEPIRIATAGPTADGREIKDQWLQDIADTYDYNMSPAYVWPEHEHRSWFGTDNLG